MPKVFTSQSQRTGELGEHIAVRYLLRKGFTLVERNFTRPCGEIDIIARSGDIMHFVEVKTKTGHALVQSSRDGAYRPEDGMHGEKVRRLRRVLMTYLREKRWRGEWQFDFITVLLDPERRQAEVRCMENIIL